MTKEKGKNLPQKVLCQEVGKIESSKVNTSIGDVLSPQFLKGLSKVLCRPVAVGES